MRISDWSSDVCSSDLTNGKTTVTAMTRQLVQACGLSARAAGNISPAALAALSDALDADDLPDVWVLELSSFQLEGTHTLAPDAAVVLNVTQDHLDWHGSMRSEEHTSELQSLMRISYAVFCLNKKKTTP